MSAVSLQKLDGDEKSNPHIQRATLIDGEAITVLVGEERRPFMTHRKLICAFSPFFHAACNGPWKESEGVIPLPADDREVFGIYLKWLYTNEFIDIGNATDKEDLDVYGKRHPLARPSIIASAYVLGDKLQDFRLKNATIDLLIQQIGMCNCYPTRLAGFVYHNTTENSPLRRLLVDFYAYICYSEPTGKWFDKSREVADMCAAPREFFVDLLPKLVEVRADPDFKKGGYPWLKNRCQYHEHPDGGHCDVKTRA